MVVRVVETGASVVPATPRELTLKPGEVAEIELVLRIPENADTVNLGIVFHAEPARG